ncbi:hypothetical protein D9O29_22595 [Pantoea vagans]|uniref:Uncharacterized protein n=1 Tax=Pantoea vagans TaxID=470934 RepID=A0ABY3L9U6_9GAMM|nr:hypothetical protein D9O29_22595 [Pantoea vagans]
MTPFSRPACTADVNYTVTQKATVPHEQWVAFVLAITEVFWQLPKSLRPCDPTNGTQAERSSALFPDPEMFLFSGMNGDGFTDQSVLITRLRSNSTGGKLDVIAPHGQPVDFFTRLVLVLLYNHCEGCFEITSSAGAASWSLPVRWLCRHNAMLNLTSPESFRDDNVFNGTADELMLTMMSGAERIVTTQEWLLINEFEYRLYGLRSSLE